MIHIAAAIVPCLSCVQDFMRKQRHFCRCLYRFIPQPASGRFSALPCLVVLLLWFIFIGLIPFIQFIFHSPHRRSAIVAFLSEPVNGKLPCGSGCFYPLVLNLRTALQSNAVCIKFTLVHSVRIKCVKYY